MHIIKYLIHFSFYMALLSPLIGCDNPQKNNTLHDNAKQIITVASSANPKPFTYYSSKGELTGFDIDVIKAVFKQLPEYQVNYVITEFSSILAGLDADRYQIGANNFVMNNARQEKYYFSVPIFENRYVIAVAADRHDISSFDDLKGKKTEVMPGVNFTTALEQYNSQLSSTHKIQLNYTEADLLATLINVESHKTDFNLINNSMLQQYIQEHNLKLKAIPLSDNESEKIGKNNSYLLVAKTPEGAILVEKINHVLIDLGQDGTLGKISHHYFGDDYIPYSSLGK